MTHASLFSGIGGPEVAAAMLGWENAFHCEINPFGRAVLEYWFPNSVSYEDITKTDFKPWRGRIDVLTGGFPCQPFSYAGQRRGHEDDRYLWPQMLRAIDEIRPAWVVGENVAGITTMVEGGLLADLGGYATLFQEGDELHGYELEQTFTIERICGDLERLGYSVQPMLVPAAAVGAPHRRDRIFILAADRNADNLRGGFTKERSLCKGKNPESEGICGEVHWPLADTHRRDDTRSPGGYAGAGREERVQERDEVWEPGIADNLRSALQESAAYPASDGRHGDTREDGEKRCAGADGKRPSEESADRVGLRCESGIYGEQPTASDTASRGRGTLPQSVHAGVADGAVPFRDGGKWDAAGMHPEKRWADFPTISPVHRGNDGLPFDVDDLSIPFTRWRTESLKAYGNAIVPQVMYQIFKAIETI